MKNGNNTIQCEIHDELCAQKCVPRRVATPNSPPPALLLPLCAHPRSRSGGQGGATGALRFPARVGEGSHVSGAGRHGSGEMGSGTADSTETGHSRSGSITSGVAGGSDSRRARVLHAARSQVGSDGEFAGRASCSRPGRPGWRRRWPSHRSTGPRRRRRWRPRRRSPQLCCCFFRRRSL